MEKEYNNGFLGWLFDAYAIECIIGPILYFFMDKSDVMSIVAIIIIIVALILTIVYHSTWKYKTKWISPGEHFISVRFVGDKKKQTNPFQIHRFFLFFILVLNLLNTARNFHKLYFGDSDILIIILVIYVYNAMILSGSVLISMAKNVGLIIVSIAYLIMAGSNLINYLDSNDSTYKIMVILFASLMILNVLIGLIYFHRKSNIANTMNE